MLHTITFTCPDRISIDPMVIPGLDSKEWQVSGYRLDSTAPHMNQDASIHTIRNYRSKVNPFTFSVGISEGEGLKPMKYTLLTVEAHLPEVLFGNSERLLSTPAELMAAQTMLQGSVRRVLGLSPGTRVLPSKRGGYYRRLDMVWNFRGDRFDLLGMFAMVRSSYMPRTKAMIVPGETVTYRKREMLFTVYDKTKEMGVTGMQPVHRAELRLSTPAAIRLVLQLPDLGTLCDLNFEQLRSAYLRFLQSFEGDSATIPTPGGVDRFLAKLCLQHPHGGDLELYIREKGMTVVGARTLRRKVKKLVNMHLVINPADLVKDGRLPLPVHVFPEKVVEVTKAGVSVTLSTSRRANSNHLPSGKQPALNVC